MAANAGFCRKLPAGLDRIINGLALGLRPWCSSPAALGVLGRTGLGLWMGRGDLARLSVGREGLAGSRGCARVALMHERSLYVIRRIASAARRATMGRG